MDSKKEKLLEILKEDINDFRVLQAIKEVPREEFVPEKLKKYAYMDGALEIGYGQTISQPYMVAVMCEELELMGNEVVLDIGTGSGYLAAILSKLCKRVVSIEIVPELVEISKERFKRLGYDNIEVIQGNGRDGYAKGGPYDRIVCSAVSKRIPEPWREQIKDGGTILIPLYVNDIQELIKAKKVGDIYNTKALAHVKFVPLVDR